jgi:hypothetical protein
MLSQICFSQIKGEFYCGQYGEFNVIMDKTNGYINASKLCVDGGKKFCHWNETKMSKELIKLLQEQLFHLALCDEDARDPWTLADHCPITGHVCKQVLTANQTDEDKQIAGTYCHPLLIPHIACWVSPSFALKVGSIINSSIAEEWKCKLDVAQRLQQDLEMSVQSLQNDLDIWHDCATENAEMLEVKREVVNELEEVVAQKKIKKHRECSSSHTFALLKLNEDNACFLPYYVIECQKVKLTSSINRLCRKHPRAEVIFRQNIIPNAINLYKRLKAEEIVKTKRNYCIPVHSKEEELVKYLHDLCATN